MMVQLDRVNGQCQSLKVKLTGKPELVTEMYIGDLMAIVPTSSSSKVSSEIHRQ